MRNRKYIAWTLVALLLAAPGMAVAQTTRPAGDAPTMEDVTPGEEGKAPAEEDKAPADPNAPVDPNDPADPNAADPNAPGNGGGLFGGGMWQIFLIMGAFLLLYVWMGRSRRKQEAQRRQMLENLKKGMKVTTIGGIRGTVLEVREKEVVVKVDEQNNVKMRFARRAVHEVEDGEGKDEDKK